MKKEKDYFKFLKKPRSGFEPGISRFRVSSWEHRKLDIFWELRCDRNSTKSVSLRRASLKQTEVVKKMDKTIDKKFHKKGKE